MHGLTLGDDDSKPSDEEILKLKTLFTILNRLCKTRGHKVIVKLFSHEVSHLGMIRCFFLTIIRTCVGVFQDLINKQKVFWLLGDAIYYAFVDFIDLHDSI